MKSQPNPYRPPVTNLRPLAGEPALPEVSQPGMSGRSWGTLLLLCAAATIAYVGRSCLGVASKEVEAELQLDVDGMSWVLSSFFWSYALAQVPAGLLAQVWGVRRSLALYALLWSLACASVGGAFGLGTLVAAQLVFGAAQAGVFPSSAAAISRWLPASLRAVASGALGACMSVGGAVGVAATGLLLTTVSWRVPFLLYALPGVVWAAVFLAWYRDAPEDAAETPADAPAAGGGRAGSLAVWSRVLLSKDLWMVCGQQFFRAAGLVFFSTWFPRFLMETRGLTTSQAGMFSSYTLLSVVGGSLLGGVLLDAILAITGSRRWSRQGVAVIAMFGCAGLILLSSMIHSALLAVVVISLGTFMASLAGPCAYSVTIDKGGQQVAPVFGVMNMTGNFGAALSPLAVGLYVKLSGGDWNGLLLLFVAIYAAAGCCWLAVNPHGTFAGGPEEGHK